MKFRYHLLNPEQQVIVDKWDKESKDRSSTVDELINALKSLDQKRISLVYQKLIDLTPSHCEHGKEILLDCLECEEIDRILHPEFFKD